MSYRPAKSEQGRCDLGKVLLLPQVDGLEHVHISNSVILKCLLEPETRGSVSASNVTRNFISLNV
jgi:hypothetical protein